MMNALKDNKCYKSRSDGKDTTAKQYYSHITKRDQIFINIFYSDEAPQKEESFALYKHLISDCFNKFFAS
jgi:hypothetical protein